MNESHVKCDVRSQYLLDKINELNASKEEKVNILMALHSINDSKLSYAQFFQKFKPSHVSIHQEVEEIDVTYLRFNIKIQDDGLISAVFGINKSNELFVLKFIPS